MMWWRRSRVDLGKYENPPVIPLAPIDRVVDEGVLISASAVRMAIKNDLIVMAVRDQRAYDPEAIATAARQRLGALATENDETADRLNLASASADVSLAGSPKGNKADKPEEADDADENDALRNEDHRRRPAVHRLLADALRHLADDPVAVAELVDSARLDAAQEIGGAVVGRLRARDFAADPAYAAERDQRLRGLIDEDLAGLTPAE